MAVKVYLSNNPQDHTHRTKEARAPSTPRTVKKFEKGHWVIIGNSTKPDDTWTCNTDVVWPVLNSSAFARPPKSSEGLAYVCRHQIQAGD